MLSNLCLESKRVKSKTRSNLVIKATSISKWTRCRWVRCRQTLSTMAFSSTKTAKLHSQVQPSSHSQTIWAWAGIPSNKIQEWIWWCTASKWLTHLTLITRVKTFSSQASSSTLKEICILILIVELGAQWVNNSKLRISFKPPNTVTISMYRIKHSTRVNSHQSGWQTIISTLNSL